MNYRDAGLSDKEYERIKELLGREPNGLETALIGVMWSEHCSYKSTRSLLSLFPQKGPAVVQGPGENAGIVDCGGGWGLAFKVESHNHPSAVVPYHGAATGVGGIMRDILAMGACPAAAMDGIFLGPPDTHRSVSLASGIVEGIAAYGNTLGVPTIGGKTFYDGCFEENPLVNAFGCGLVKLDSIVSSKTARAGDFAVLLGSRTGRDGVAGASFASKELGGEHDTRPRIPTGDPFEEKLLIDCCLELKEAGLIESMQDMGAAGILSSSSEVAHKSGVGIEIFCEDIPLREKMEPFEIFLSESQERMLLVVDPEKFDAVKAVASRYGLECASIGNITEGDRYRVFASNELLADLPLSVLGDAEAVEWASAVPADLEERSAQIVGMKSLDPGRDLLELIGSVHGRERKEIWEQYDCQAQLRTAEEPGYPVSAIKLPDPDSIVVFAMEADPWKCGTSPYYGAAEVMAGSIRLLALSGATALGMTNCLNFASPEKPENFFDLSECVRGLADVCKEMECPVVSGNVSLYNETANCAIYPTPLVVTVGLVPHYAYYVTCGRAMPQDAVYLVGPPEGALGASRWQVMRDGVPRGSTWKFDADLEKDFVERAIKTSRRAGLRSARVITGGGLAVALAKEAIVSGNGMKIDFGELGEVCRQDAETAARVLFGEGGPRAVYFVPRESEEKFLSIWEGYDAVRIGEVEGEALAFGGMFEIGIEDLSAAFRGENCPGLLEYGENG